MEVNQVYLGDCVEIMKTFSKESVDLVFADPPYNIGVNYDKYQDNLTYDEYYDWSRKWIEECYRVLKRSGSIYIAIGDEFAAEINVLLKKTGFYFRNWIIWYYTFGQHQRKKFCRSHTHIHYFSKDKNNFIFNADAVRVPSARQLKYNDKRANCKGRVPDDVWGMPDKIWKMSRVCGTFNERIGKHPCQLPEALLERIIKASSNDNDIVLDPFSGTGTTAVVAKKLNRKYITIEISEGYYDITIRRLNGEFDNKNTGKRKDQQTLI